MTTHTPHGSALPPSTVPPDDAGRDGSPDRDDRSADPANAGEEFGSGFGGYQGGNQADPQGGDAGGRADPNAAATPTDRDQATKPPDRE